MADLLSVKEVLEVLGGKALGHEEVRVYLTALREGGFVFSSTLPGRIDVGFRGKVIGIIHFDNEHIVCHENHIRL